MALFSRLLERFRELSLQEKLIAVLLFSLGGGALVFGLLSFGAFAHRPFEIQLAENAKKGRYESLDAQAAREVKEQKARDSDQDGLNDYDEMMIYKTSPYLSDTDSDGADDKTETLNGDNPNCPRGKSCELAIERPQETLVGGVVAPGENQVEALQALLAQSGAQDPSSITALLQGLSAEELRRLAVEVGVPEDQLSSLDDAALRARFLEALSQAQVRGEFATP